MATIRATCPACNASVEVDADKAGTEVECGECLQVFKVKGAGGKIKGSPSARGKAPAAGTKPAARRRADDDDEDEDDYEHDHVEEYDEDDYDPGEARGRRRPRGMPSSGGTFALGVLAVMTTCIPFVSIPVAIVALRRPPAVAYPYGASGLVRIGKLLAQVSLGLWVLVVLLLYLNFRRN
jgi:predicted Zn finger-like uncharacterized protein